MTRHKISFEIMVETNEISNEQFEKIINKIESSMLPDGKNYLNFLELSEMIPLLKLKYYPSRMDYSNLDRDEFAVRETKILIKA